MEHRSDTCPFAGDLSDCVRILFAHAERSDAPRGLGPRSLGVRRLAARGLFHQRGGGGAHPGSTLGPCGACRSERDGREHARAQPSAGPVRVARRGVTASTHALLTKKRASAAQAQIDRERIGDDEGITHGSPEQRRPLRGRLGAERSTAAAQPALSAAYGPSHPRGWKRPSAAICQNARDSSRVLPSLEPVARAPASDDQLPRSAPPAPTPNPADDSRPRADSRGTRWTTC